MVQIQSSWFSPVDRTPQSRVSNTFEARPDDFVAVESTVCRSAGGHGSLEIGLLP